MGSVITKSEFVSLLSVDEFARFLEELKKEENFVLKQIWDNVLEIDVDSETADKFVQLLENIGIDIVQRYKDKKSVINKYVVSLEGRGVEYVLMKYAGLHDGEAMWVGQIDSENDTVELFVKNGKLLV